MWGENGLVQTFVLVLPDARQNRNLSEAGLSYPGICGRAWVRGRGVLKLKINMRVHVYFTGIVCSFYQILEVVPDSRILKTTILEHLLV